ncbi:hypothetical protein EC07798_4648, partial [Escherichia coli 07798]
CDALFFSS